MAKPRDEPKNITTQDFHYELPEEQIAHHPLAERDQAKLLIYEKGEIRHSHFRHLTEHLPEGAALLFNDTKVVPARLQFQKDTGANIEIFCLEPGEEDPTLSFGMRGEVVWPCMIGNLKKWKQGQVLHKSHQENGVTLKAQFEGKSNQQFKVRFTWNPSDYNWAEILEYFGETPLPPYIKRETEKEDKERYQTVFSKKPGAVAAPTASLHFTQRIFKDLQKKKHPTHSITLHTGMGTFKPVTESNPYNHTIHREMVIAEKETIKFLRDNSGNLIMAGTTAIRAAESVYWLGLFLEKYQTLPEDHTLKPQFIWDCQEEKLPPAETVLQNLIDYLESQGQEQVIFKTGLFILPGYPFPLTRGLITNFHLPQSTLLMLVGTFIGDDWKKVYQEGLHQQYRFLSYGDGSLLIP